MPKVLEKDIQALLRQAVLQSGFGCRKYLADVRRGGTPGTPDVIVELNGGRVIWVECKQPASIAKYLKKRERFFADGNTKGCSSTEIRQFREQQKLLDLGHDVRIMGTPEQVEDFSHELTVLDY